MQNEIIHQIVYIIKHKQDYNYAGKLMTENDISIQTLCNKTLKLNQLDLAKLADAIIESRR